MVKAYILFVLALLFCALPGAAITETMTIGYIESENIISFDDVGDVQFNTAPGNQIKFIKIVAADSSGNISIKTTTPDYIVWANSSRLPCAFCVFRHDYNTSVAVYRGGSLLYTNSTLQTIIGNNMRVEISEQGINVQRGLPSVFATVWFKHPILTSSTATIQANTPLVVDLVIINNDIIAQNKMISELPPLFAVLYHLIVDDGKTFELGIDDSNSTVLSIFYYISTILSVVVFVLLMCLTSTWAVVAFIEGVIIFYAGWRNNDLKHFLNDYIGWHKGLIILMIEVANKLYTALIDALRAIRG